MCRDSKHSVTGVLSYTWNENLNSFANDKEFWYLKTIITRCLNKKLIGMYNFRNLVILNDIP